MTSVWVIYLVSASSTSASASLSRWGSDWTHSSCNMSHRHEQTHHFYNSTQNLSRSLSLFLTTIHLPTYLSAIALWVSGHYCPVFPTFVTLQAAFLEQWEQTVMTPFNCMVSKHRVNYCLYKKKPTLKNILCLDLNCVYNMCSNVCANLPWKCTGYATLWHHNFELSYNGVSYDQQSILQQPV